MHAGCAMSHYAVRDLGAGFSPWEINSQGEVLGREFPNAGSGWSVHFADNTVMALPPAVEIGIGISDDGIVLGRGAGMDVVLFDTKTATLQPFSIPGFPFIADLAIDALGNLAGSAGRQNAAGELRGFLWERNTQALTWIYPASVPHPPGAAPYLRLNDRNLFGHAAGRQGWIRNGEQQQVPIFYDGATVRTIGSYASMANGTLISNSDRVSAWYFPQSGPEYRAIYDGATNTLTPFLSGRIVDLNAAGQTLWESAWPGMASYVTDATGTQSLILAFPPGSGWEDIAAVRMNDAGAIVGFGLLGKQSHGFMLTPEWTYPTGRVKEIAAMILWGIINDAGGIQIVGGRLIPIPPRSPLDELLGALPAELNKALSDAVGRARLDDPIGAQRFSGEARRIIEEYRRS